MAVGSVTSSTSAAALASAGASAGTSASAGASASASSTKSAEQSDRFLKLLVAQMNNQDPLNPLDNAQVTTQMAQISTVEGIENLNISMQNFLNRNSAVSALEGAGLIGQRVLVNGDSLTLGASPVDGSARTAVPGGYDLTESAALVRVEVLAPTGAVMATQEMRNVEAGVHSFTWDGRTDAGTAAAAGRYQFRVSAGAPAELKPVTALQSQSVSAVISGTSGPRIEIGGGNQYSLSDIRAILQENKQ